MLGMPSGREAFKVAGALYFVLIVGWCRVLSARGGWHEGHSFIWNFSVSLFDFGVSRNAGARKADQHHTVTQLSQRFDSMKMLKPIGLDVVRYLFCRDVKHNGSWSEDDPWCTFLRRLHITSWTLLLFCTVGTLCLGMGTMAGFNFHYVKPRDDLRTWAAAYLLAAPVLFCIGVTQYWFATNDFSMLVDESVNGGYLANGTFGYSFGAAVILSITSWIPAWIMIGFAFGPSRFEDCDGDWLRRGATQPEVDYGAAISRFSTPPEPVVSSTNPHGAGGVEDPESQQGREGSADTRHGGEWRLPSSPLQKLRTSIAAAHLLNAVPPAVRESVLVQAQPVAAGVIESDLLGFIAQGQLGDSSAQSDLERQPGASSANLQALPGASHQPRGAPSADSDLLGRPELQGQPASTNPQSDLAGQPVTSSAPSDLVGSANEPPHGVGSANAAATSSARSGRPTPPPRVTRIDILLNEESF